MNKYYSIYFIFVACLFSCENKSAKQETTDTEIETIDKGLVLLQNNCFSCHSPVASAQESGVAPSLPTIKKYYLGEKPSKESFLNDFQTFLNDPIPKNSKVPNATEKYGLMPKMGLSDKQIAEIATYLYDTDLEKKDWYKAKSDSGQAELSYEELGQKYALGTKSVLGKNLLGAIKAKGTEHALSFCNTRAYPLTDSMAVAFGASIKRVSDKPRNPANQANDAEIAYIESVKSLLAKGEKPKAQVQELNGKMVGYYPIETNQMCLQCHGTPKTEIKPQTLQKIATLYPQDRAVGYSENQLRGIWVVEMNKK